MKRYLLPLSAGCGILAVAWWLSHSHQSLSVLWLIGIGLGVALQRSRFCVAAAFEDAILFYDTRPARAVLVTLALSSVLFGIIQYHAMQTGSGLPGGIQPVTAGSVVGPFLFGVGMVMAGGCALSSLLRLGEGHLRYGWTLIGLTAGSAAGALHYGWWERLLGRAEPLHFPSQIGWPSTILLQLLLLAGALGLLRWWEQQGGGSIEADDPGPDGRSLSGTFTEDAGGSRASPSRR